MIVKFAIKMWFETGQILDFAYRATPIANFVQLRHSRVTSKKMEKNKESLQG